MNTARSELSKHSATEPNRVHFLISKVFLAYPRSIYRFVFLRQGTARNRHLCLPHILGTPRPRHKISNEFKPSEDMPIETIAIPRATCRFNFVSKGTARHCLLRLPHLSGGRMLREDRRARQQRRGATAIGNRSARENRGTTAPVASCGCGCSEEEATELEQSPKITFLD